MGAQDLSEVIAAVRDKAAYPSPLIAVGAMHSVTRCIEADQGTIVCMAGFHRIVGLAGAYDSAVQARPYTFARRKSSSAATFCWPVYCLVALRATLESAPARSR